MVKAAAMAIASRSARQAAAALNPRARMPTCPWLESTATSRLARTDAAEQGHVLRSSAGIPARNVTTLATAAVSGGFCSARGGQGQAKVGSRGDLLNRA